MGGTLKDLSGRYTKVSSPEPHVALVQLSRDPVNAFNEEFWTEYGRVFDTIGKDPDVRVVVLASDLPKLFSAGIDFSALGKLNSYDQDAGRRALQLRQFIFGFQSCITATERCPYPVIAAVHGAAIGLSIDIIAACDVRYAAENTQFAIKEVDMGLTADIGTLARLPKLAGNQSMVHEFAYTARAFSAGEAERMGLVSRVVPGGRDEVLAAALETARIIARKSPIAVVGTKRVLQHARDHTVEENLEYVATWNSVMLQSADMDAAFKAALTKQPAVFSSLGFKAPAKL